MADVLLVRPSYDTTTSVMHSWADEIWADIQAGGSHACRDLSGADATRGNVEAELRQDTDLLAFYGHGQLDSLEPQDGLAVQSAVVDTTNSYLLDQKLVYAVACHSAATLGQDALNQGAIAYMGYIDILVIVLGGCEVWFGRAANAAVLHLLASSPQGNPSCSAAINHAKNMYNVAINHFKRGPGISHPNRGQAIAYLTWNRDRLRLVNNQDASLP